MDARITYRLPHGVREDIYPLISRLVAAYDTGAIKADIWDHRSIETVERDIRTLRQMLDGSYKTRKST